jgi:hypothetical protein
MSTRYRRKGLLIAVAWLASAIFPALGCLRETLDARAIQWSQLIVKATFNSVTPPQNLGNEGWQYRIYTFTTNEVLDGSAAANDTIAVVRFMGPQYTRTGPCAQTLTDQQVGKSFVLLLRKEQDLPWSTLPTNIDQRTPALHDRHAFVLVNIQSGDDLDADGMADLKRQIADVRAAEAAFNPADAQVQANVLANAADATEAQEAEHALLEMGPKALTVIQAAAAQAPPAGQTRLTRIAQAVSPPSIVDETAGTTRP